jgi:hypothetical protein
MAMNPRLLRPSSFSPKSISGLALWLDGSDASSLYTTDAGPVEAVSSPLDISGCVGWWDASDSDTLFAADTGSTPATTTVGRLEDKSDQGIDLIQPTEAARPAVVASYVNGRSALTFDGGDFISAATSVTLGDNTVVMVAREDVSVNYGGLFVYYPPSGNDNGNANGWVADLQLSNDNILSLNSGGFVAAYAGSTTLPLSVLTLRRQTAIGDKQSIRLNGATVAVNSSALTGTASGILIGGRFQSGAVDALYRAKITLCEVARWDRVLTPSELASVERYLAAKWGISGVHAPATSGEPVGYWRDKSGNNRHATQATAASRPTVGSQNGRTALTFDGASSWMRTERTQYAARSVFTVFRRTASAASYTYKAVFAKQQSVEATVYGGSAYASSQTGGFSVASSATSNRLYWNNAALSAAYVQGASMPLADAANYQVGVPAALDTVTPALLYAEVAGEASGNQAWFVGTEPYGTARKYPADVLECLIYNRALTTSERRSLERYLARRWGITLAPQVSDADAQSWVDRVYAAGSTVSQPVANSVNSFVLGCKSDGIWDAMKSVVLLAGADTLAGALAPLKGTAPTSYNFVSGDYSQTSGLVGNGSTKYLDSNRAMDDDPLDDHHATVYITQAESSANTRMYLGADGANADNYDIYRSDTELRFRSRSSSGATASGAGPATGFAGLSRASSASFFYRVSGSTATAAISSVATDAVNLFVFGRNASGPSLLTDARLAFYSVGEALDLEDLDARVSGLMFAIRTGLNPDDYDSETIRYINAGYSAGGSLA